MSEYKTLGYCRVSSEEQSLKKTSIDAQIALIKEFDSSAEIICDEGISAKEESQIIDPEKLLRKRDGLRLIIEKVRSGGFNRVYITDWDRLSRDSFLFQYLLRLEGVYNFKWWSITQSNDSFARTIMGEVGVKENKDKSERVKRVLTKKKEQGRAISRPPLGYKINHIMFNGQSVSSGVFVIDQKYKKIYLRLVDEFLKGVIYDDIVSILNYEFEKILKHNISRITIRRMLQNKTYAGFLRDGGDWRPGKHQPLIDVDIYDRIIVEMNKRKNKVYNK